MFHASVCNISSYVGSYTLKNNYWAPVCASIFLWKCFSIKHMKGDSHLFSHKFTRKLLEIKLYSLIHWNEHNFVQEVLLLDYHLLECILTLHLSIYLIKLYPTILASFWSPFPFEIWLFIINMFISSPTYFDTKMNIFNPKIYIFSTVL